MKPFNLKATSSTPLHVQFAEQLTERIRKKQWQIGEKIPSERELMELAGVSRATVRQAIGGLEQQGVLARSPGSGTFVAAPKIEQPMTSVYSFSEQFKARGLELRDELLERSLVKADDNLSQKLHIKKHSKVIYLHRLRRFGKSPFMVSKTYISHALCPELFDAPLETTLYQHLIRYQLPVLSATDTLEALSATKELAKLLELPAHIPLLFVERIALTTGERVLHLGLNYIRADKCSFNINLSSRASVLELKSA
ncbi:MAG: GntR family transcriptional regulator [Trueperaceae bacterium]